MKKIVAATVLISSLFSCSKINNPTPQPPTTYNNGVFICNEGAFSGGTGTVSFYNPDEKSIQHDIYQNANTIPIGNVLQSAAQEGNKLYFVVNNAEKIVVTDHSTLELITEIKGFSSPRYFQSVSSTKAYVSEWGTNSVKIVDLNTHAISGSVTCGNGPEKMAYNNGKLYVANSGGFVTDSTVTIIDAALDSVVHTISTGINPNSLSFDANGYLWILCGGFSDWNEPTGANDIAGKLMKIDVNNNYTVLSEFYFPNKTDHPAHLTIDGTGQNLHYLSSAYFGSVYQMNIMNNSLPTNALVSGGFYSMALDQGSNEIYTADPKDYNSEGTMYRYSSNGTILDSVKTGIIPNYFLFR